MKISVNWLKKFTKVDISVDELISKIGAQLGAIEEVIDLSAKYRGIKIVQITEAKPHPDADKLSVYQIYDGSENIQVVAGDKTLKIGDKVAWIAPGQIVPATYFTDQPFTIGTREMRGETSNGMLGSSKELDLSEDNSGVLVLDTDSKPGTLLAEAYDLDDTIIDIENKMFTHRPDCFGLIGVAREVAGIQNISFESPDWYLLESGKMFKPSDDTLPISVENNIPMLVPQYHVVAMSGVEIKPSPIQLQSYLKRIGIRPINNVVDTTNYIMYLTGQPLHAFDYDKIAEHGKVSIVVRTPKDDEEIKILDGRTIKPHSEAVIIANKHQPIALGGVIGGANSEVDENTKNIVIESAHFNMYSIRRTSMEHGIFTDAVTRFNKGQSESQCKVVLSKAIELMGEYANAKLTTEFGIEKPEALLPKIDTSVKFINDRLGSELKASHIKKLLTNVEMEVDLDGNSLKVQAPYWRTDIEIPEDVVEEVGRLHGYDALPHSLPNRPALAVKNLSLEDLKTRIRQTLASAGNNELQTYSFVSGKLLDKTDQDSKPAYRIRNALSPKLEFIRTSLLPSLLEKVHPNHKSGYDQFGIFEIGKSHNKHEIGEDLLPIEKLSLSYVFSVNKKSEKQYEGAPYYQAKYQLDYLLDRLHIKDIQYKKMDNVESEYWWTNNLSKIFEPKRSALIVISGHAVGVVGEFKSDIKRNFKLPEFVAGFELDISRLHGMIQKESYYKPLLRYPSTEQDVCFKVSKDVSYENLESLIKNSFANDQRLQVEISPLDIYEKDKNHKQITYRVRLQHHDKTLVTKEVNQMMDQLADNAKSSFKAERI